MPTNLTEVSTYDATVAVPLSGDPRTASSVVGAFQSLANRTKWFNLNTLSTAGGTRTLSTPLIIAGQLVTFSAGASASTLDITGATSLLGTVVSGAFQALGSTIVLGATSACAMSVNAIATMTGTGRLRRRATVVADIGNRTLTIADGDLLIARAVAAPCDWTLGNTGAAFPDEIEVYNATSSNAITVKDSAGASIAVLKSGSGSSRSGRFVFDLDGTGKFVALGAEDAT